MNTNTNTNANANTTTITTTTTHAANNATTTLLSPIPVWFALRGLDPGLEK